MALFVKLYVVVVLGTPERMEFAPLILDPSNGDPFSELFRSVVLNQHLEGLQEVLNGLLLPKSIYHQVRVEQFENVRQEKVCKLVESRYEIVQNFRESLHVLVQDALRRHKVLGHVNDSATRNGGWRTILKRC